MPEKLTDKTVFTLAEVASSIQKTIAARYQSTYWIKAEMNKLNHYTHSGHCYPELVEKKEGKVVAEMRAILWKADYERINELFMSVAKEPLKNGITILLQGKISYDPLYGLSLRITDIDPAFALGELEREKQLSIQQLKAQGLFDANKRLPFPLLPKRLAIISVETSKGYSDFLKIIDQNPWGYRIEYELHTALLQGDKSIVSIINQLQRIAAKSDAYDAVAIIRGGGGDVGLSSYNNYELASTIAQFPIPVLTGIGHSTNETVSEMVAYKNAITPSELADFLIQHFHNFAVPVARAETTLLEGARALLQRKREGLDNIARHFKTNSFHLLQNQRLLLDRLEAQLPAHCRNLLGKQQDTLTNLERTVKILDPLMVLKRGYSITRHAGKLVMDAAELPPGTVIVTQLAEGQISSTVNS